MKNTALSLITAAVIALSGCSSSPSCVAIQNSAEKIIPAKVIGKKRIDGPVLLNPPKSVRITGHSASGGTIPEKIIVLAAFAVVGVAAAGESPGALRIVGTQMGKNVYNSPSIPASQDATLGEPCNNEGILLENGATQYTVTNKSNTYNINSAYPGFEIGDCVNVFVSRYGSNTNARVARGFDCDGL